MSHERQIIAEGEEFGLTEQDVIDAIAEAEKRVAEFREGLNDPDERIRRALTRSLPMAELQLAALTAGLPIEILGRVQTFYDRTLALEGLEWTKREMAVQLNTDFSDLMNFYGLLRRRTWGYHLGQSVAWAKSFVTQESPSPK